MKRVSQIISWLIVLGGLALLPSSCVVAGGRISGGAAIQYGPLRFWFYDGPWLDGWRGWYDGIYIQPPPIYFGGTLRPHIPDRPRPGPRR